MRVTLAEGVHRLGRCRKGSVAIEFALVGLWLILLLGITAEVGVFMFYQFAVQNAADLAARQIEMRKVALPADPDQPTLAEIEAFKTLACGNLPIQNCADVIRIDVRKASSFDALTTPQVTAVGPTLPGGSYSEIYFPGSSRETGSLIITYDWKFIFPFMQWYFGNVPGRSDIRRLYGISIYKNEE